MTALIAPAQTAKAKRRMRTHVALCAGIVLASAWGVWAFDRWQQAAQGQHTSARQAAKQAQHKLDNSDQELKTIQAQLPKLQRMIDMGRYGDPLRLDWVEAIEQTPKRLPGVVIDQYQISPLGTTLPFTPPESAKTLFNAAQLQKVSLHVTEVNLNARLMHEGDLMALLARLQNPKLGFSTLRSCDLRSPPARTDHLVAHCELYWLTLKHSGEKTP